MAFSQRDIEVLCDQIREGTRRMEVEVRVDAPVCLIKKEVELIQVRAQRILDACKFREHIKRLQKL